MSIDGTTRLLTVSAKGDPASERGPGHRRGLYDGRVPVGGDLSLRPLDPPTESSSSASPSGTVTRVDVAADGGLASRREHVTGDQRRRPLRGVCLKADLTCTARGRCAGDNGVADVYVRDTRTNMTRRISRSVSGAEPNGASYDPAISGNGRYVAFVSEASNLTRDQVRRGAQIYVHDLISGTTELITRTRAGRPGNGNSLRPAMSDDGLRIAYQSLAADLLCDEKCRPGQADINLQWDVFLFTTAGPGRPSAPAATAAATGWSTAGPPPWTPAADRRLRHASSDRRPGQRAR